MGRLLIYPPGPQRRRTHFATRTHLQTPPIAADVITGGITHRNLRLKRPAVRTRADRDFSLDINAGQIELLVRRFTFIPPITVARIFDFPVAHSQSIAPEEDILRMTASSQYNRPLQRALGVAAALGNQMRIWSAAHRQQLSARINPSIS